MDRISKYLDLKNQFNIREEERKKEGNKALRLLLEDNKEKLTKSKEYKEKLNEHTEQEAIRIEKKFNGFTEDEKEKYVIARKKLIEEYNQNIEPWEINNRIGGIDRKIHSREVPIYKRMYNIIREESIIKDNEILNLLIDDEGNMFPYTSEGNNLSSKVQVRLSESEKIALDEICSNTGNNISKLIRELIKKEISTSIKDDKISFCKEINHRRVQVLSSYSEAVDFIVECLNKSIELDGVLDIRIETDLYNQTCGYKAKEIILTEYEENDMKNFNIKIDDNINFTINTDDYIDIIYCIDNEQDNLSMEQWNIKIVSNQREVNIYSGTYALFSEGHEFWGNQEEELYYTTKDSSKQRDKEIEHNDDTGCNIEDSNEFGWNIDNNYITCMKNNKL